MSIRAKIAVYQLIVVTMLLSSAAATYFAISRIDYYFERADLTREQIEVVMRVAAQMNRYSENIAELLLLGRPELSDFYAARSALDRGLVRLAHLVDDELEFLVDPRDRAAAEVERTRVNRMRELFLSIDKTAERLLILREEGRVDAAIDLFREQIEETLDAELQQLVNDALADEEGELREAELRTNTFGTQLEILVIGMAIVSVLGSGIASLVLGQSLTRPIRALIQGARAVGDGELSHRIAETGRGGEFADLARQFNATAARLEDQRSKLLAVQAGLETEVVRRTGELEDANQRLQRLDQMRMLFLAEIGHELRTPITVMRGEAEVTLRDERSTSEYRETLGRVVHLAHQMGRLVDDLLFLARAEVGAVRFDMQLLTLQEVVDAALASARTLAGSNDLEIVAAIPDKACLIDGDAERLTQALLIVFDNAVKYSDPFGQIDVDLEHADGEAIVRIRNFGETIPPGDLPYVFNRFYRGRQGVRAETPGVGLGLPIAKWIVDNHGGGIDVTSVDRETVVTIRLPVVS